MKIYSPALWQERPIFWRNKKIFLAALDFLSLSIGIIQLL